MFKLTVNRLARPSRNSLRAGKREEIYRTCVMRTLLFTYVNVDLSANLSAKVL